jgi:micrococcal nuclease
LVPGRCRAEPAEVRAVVIRPLDAGTLLVQPDGQRALVTIRLIGLDAPRKSTRDQEGQEPWGTRAQQFLSLLATRKEVRIEFDVVVPTEDGTARWGYVWLGDRLLNEEVLRAGHAVLATRPPNVRHVERLQAAQAEAREKQRGIWDPTDPLPQTPAEFVAAQARQAEAMPKSGTLPAYVEGCVIGNAQSRIYHVPGGRFYALARTSQHAVFFRTAEEAKQAGFTPASR